MSDNKTIQDELAVYDLLSNSEIGHSLAWALVDHGDIVFPFQQASKMDAVAGAVVDNWRTGTCDATAAIEDILGHFEYTDRPTVMAIWAVLEG